MSCRTFWCGNCCPGTNWLFWLPSSEKIRYKVVKTMKLFILVVVLYMPGFIHSLVVGFQFRIFFGASFLVTVSWPKFEITAVVGAMQVFMCSLWLLETLGVCNTALKVREMYRLNKSTLAQSAKNAIEAVNPEKISAAFEQAVAKFGEPPAVTIPADDKTAAV